MVSVASAVVAFFGILTVASAKTVVITVGGNTTDDARLVFQPPTVEANRGDVIYFNFTQGNHTVTQSVFAAPCIPAHDFNETINGFDSGFRDAGDFQAITNLQIPVTDNTTTIWFFDWNTCAQGGVGGVNLNDSSLETYDGFVRNALRLNGSEAETSTFSSTASRTNTATASPSNTNASNDSSRSLKLGAVGVIPLVIGAFALLA